MTNHTLFFRKRYTTAALLAGGAALALTAGPAAAATFSYNGSGDFEDASSWDLVSGTAATGSPPPANGDIGQISIDDGSNEFGASLYDPGSESPPAEIQILTGGKLTLGTGIGDNHNLVLDGGTLSTDANRFYGGTLFVRSDSTLDSGAQPSLRGPIQDAPDGSGGTTTGALTITDGEWNIDPGNTGANNNGFSGGFVITGAGATATPADEGVFGTGDVLVQNEGNVSFADTSGVFNLTFDGGSLEIENNNAPDGSFQIRSTATILQNGGGSADTVGVFSDETPGTPGQLIYDGTGGELDLEAASTYTGGTIVDSTGTGTGTLNANIDGALGLGDVVVTPTGSLQLSTDGSILSTQGLSIDSSGTDFGQTELAADVTVASLILGGTSIDPGTFTASSNSNGVDFANYFTGDGSITTVVPEPASLALLGLGGLAMLGRRRRRSGVKA